MIFDLHAEDMLHVYFNQTFWTFISLSPSLQIRVFEYVWVLRCCRILLSKLYQVPPRQSHRKTISLEGQEQRCITEEHFNLRIRENIIMYRLLLFRSFSSEQSNSERCTRNAQFVWLQAVQMWAILKVICKCYYIWRRKITIKTVQVMINAEFIQT